LESTFESNLWRTHQMVALVDTWDSPNYLRRIWTIFEQFTAIRLGISVTMVLPQAAVKELIKEFETGKQGILRVKHALSNVDCQSSEATFEADAKKVKDRIEATIGFEAVNHDIAKFMSHWVAQQLQLYMNNLVKTDVEVINVGSCDNLHSSPSCMSFRRSPTSREWNRKSLQMKNLDSLIGNTEISDLVTQAVIDILAADYHNGNSATIEVMGSDVNFKTQRGMNFVAMDSKLAVLAKLSFDTCFEQGVESMVDWINGLAVGTIVLSVGKESTVGSPPFLGFGGFGHAAAMSDKRGYDALRSLGWSGAPLEFRESFAFVGVKGGHGCESRMGQLSINSIKLASLQAGLVTFEVSGKLGLRVLADGKVSRVKEGQGKKRGVKVGWRVHSLDQTPFSISLLKERVGTSAPFHITFLSKSRHYLWTEKGVNHLKCKGDWNEHDEPEDGSRLPQSVEKIWRERGILAEFIESKLLREILKQIYYSEDKNDHLTTYYSESEDVNDASDWTMMAPPQEVSHCPEPDALSLCMNDISFQAADLEELLPRFVTPAVGIEVCVTEPR